jgi:hypothetical protein
MSLDFATLLKTNRAAQAVAAALVLAALVGIAKIVAAHSTKPIVTSKSAALNTPAATPARPAQIVLAPNETLVAAPGKSVEPLMPHYSTPEPPPPAPAIPDQPQTPQAASAEAFAAAVEPPAQMAPLPPAPLPAATLVMPSPAVAYCTQCGEVVVLTVWPDMAEVRIRFDDGSTRTLRTPVPSPWHVGDRVRLDQGRLVRD